MEQAYEILSARSPRELERLVNAKLESGWKPIGGVSATIYVDSNLGYSRTNYHQAVLSPPPPCTE